MTTVAELMTREVQACHPWDSLNDAARLMYERDCGCVPAVDNDGRVVGILTDRDIGMAAYKQAKAPSSLAVSSAMSHEVRSCKPDDPVASAAAIMVANRVRRLPVIDEEHRLVGVISLDDLAREAARPSTAERTDVTTARLGEILAAICAEPGHKSGVPDG